MAQVRNSFHSSPSVNNGVQTAGHLTANKHQSVVTTATRFIDSISRSTYNFKSRVFLHQFFSVYHPTSRPTSFLHFHIFKSFFPFHTYFPVLFLFYCSPMAAFLLSFAQAERNLSKGMKQLTILSHLLHCTSFPINVRVL